MIFLNFPHYDLALIQMYELFSGDLEDDCSINSYSSGYFSIVDNLVFLDPDK